MKISVIGLGYVGLPLARLFATKYPVVGFDLKAERIAELNKGIDSTLEVDAAKLGSVLLDHIPTEEEKGLFCSSNVADIEDSSIYIVAVPTPVDNHNRPDLTPLYKASATVGEVISKGDIVIYESTVYPGVTEEECIPVVEKKSGLRYNVDFFAGYSPERINPGDKEHTVEKIRKVTSGSTPKVGKIVDDLYGSVLVNGTHLAPNIRVAEASKIVENCQRDVNIAFFNELAKIFSVMGIDTTDVIEASASKWNFIKLKPGLVGGHCISVDPYYLIEKSQIQGYSPNILIQAREVNNGMGEYVANQVIKSMNKRGILVKDSKILILGVSFKENCPDIRNTKVFDIYKVLSEYTTNITICDPWVDTNAVQKEYGVSVEKKVPNNETYDAVILAVSHTEFLALDFNSLRNKMSVIYDVKGILPKQIIDSRL